MIFHFYLHALHQVWCYTEKKDELVPVDFIDDLNKRLSAQKGIKVDFQAITDANHFFSKNEKSLIKSLDQYIKKETTVF